MRDPLGSYYFGFCSTGVPEIDDVLAAVARAGTAYHSTEFWSDTDFGQSETSKIQDAANVSAEILKAKDAELTSLKAENADLIARLKRAEKALEQALEFRQAIKRELADFGIASLQSRCGDRVREDKVWIGDSDDQYTVSAPSIALLLHEAAREALKERR